MLRVRSPRQKALYLILRLSRPELIRTLSSLEVLCRVLMPSRPELILTLSRAELTHICNITTFHRFTFDGRNAFLPCNVRATRYMPKYRTCDCLMLPCMP